MLGIGFEGEAKELESRGGRTTRLRVESGELFASATAWLGGTGTCPEILGLLSGSGAFGRLALARARRSGEVVLVGPESNGATAEAIATMREEGATSILVDGAFGRLTQVAALPGARFFAAMIVDRAGLATAVASMRRLATLAALPLADSRSSAASMKDVASIRPFPAASDRTDEVCHIDGALTAGRVASLSERVELVTVEDFTKIFLEEAALRALRARRRLCVRRSVEFGGFVVALRGLGAREFLEATEGAVDRGLLFPSPYEEGGGFDAA